MFPRQPVDTREHLKARCACGHWVGVSGPRGMFRIMADQPCPKCNPRGWGPVSFNPGLERSVTVEVRWSDDEHVDSVPEPLWLRLRTALENIVRDAFELPQDSPSLDHSGWRTILDLIAEASNGEDAETVLDRLKLQFEEG